MNKDRGGIDHYWADASDRWHAPPTDMRSVMLTSMDADPGSVNRLKVGPDRMIQPGGDAAQRVWGDDV